MASIGRKYIEYLQHFGRVVTVRELACRRDLKAVGLRHDVDHDIDVALEMAWLESDCQIRASYYLLHTAPYWNDPLLAEKCRQIAALGHEVALHNNLLASFVRTGAPPDETCRRVLEEMRGWGIRVDGVSGHGDPLCYEKSFLNQCFFREGQEHFNRPGLAWTAEGVHDSARDDLIVLGGASALQVQNQTYALGAHSLADMGLVYDANLVPVDRYFSDSRGHWNHDPMDVDLRQTRCQVNMHPIHYAAPARTFFILGCARSGSKWLARMLDETTTVETRHEEMLNQHRQDGESRRDCFTGAGFAERVRDPALVRERLADWKALRESEDPAADRAEVNVYLVHALDELRELYPYATFVHLHRNGRQVVNSLYSRGWYDNPEDTHHPRVEDLPDPALAMPAANPFLALPAASSGGPHAAADPLPLAAPNDLAPPLAAGESAGGTQFERCAKYWSWVVDRMDAPTVAQWPLEVLTSDPEQAMKLLAAAGIRVVLPDRFRKLCGEAVDSTPQHKLPSPEEWSGELNRAFEGAAQASMVRLGYQRETCDDGLLALTASLDQAVPRSQPLPTSQKVVLLEFRKPALPKRAQRAVGRWMQPVWEILGRGGPGHRARSGGWQGGPTQRGISPPALKPYHSLPRRAKYPLDGLVLSTTPGCEVTAERELTFALEGPWKHWAVFGTSNWHSVVGSTVARCELAAYATTEFCVARMQDISLVTLRHLYYDHLGKLIKPYSRAFNFSRSFLGHAPACKLSTCTPEGALYISVGLHFDLGESARGVVAFSRLNLVLARYAQAG